MSEFIIYWDSLGIESIIPIGRMREENIESKLLGDHEPNDIGGMINMLRMRARFNNQRSPEIWGFTVEDSVTEDDLWKLAEKFPHTLTKLVKEKGVRF